MAISLPAEMKTLICEDVGKPLELKTVKNLRLFPGAAPSNGHAPLTFPKGFCPGGRTIGRVAATGIDTARREVGQFVLGDPFVRGRDDPDVQILRGYYDGPSPASKKFMADNWAMAGSADYMVVPLENCYSLDEKELLQLAVQLVGMGGLRTIDVKAGERVIVAPATGAFSGAAVQVAIALGANVDSMGRNLKIVQNTGDVENDTAALKQWGPIDACIDISPIQAKSSTHVRACFLAFRQSVRVALLGTIGNDISVPYALATWNRLKIKGSYMYEREDITLLIKMAETGVLRLGKQGGNEVVGEFKLQDFEKAFDSTRKNPEIFPFDFLACFNLYPNFLLASP
ncbi:GroES-like protein [Thozetella sp. PMI_491]|nr:GroES-like protein [Thozetella sp. PMI_491]